MGWPGPAGDEAARWPPEPGAAGAGNRIGAGWPGPAEPDCLSVSAPVSTEGSVGAVCMAPGMVGNIWPQCWQKAKPACVPPPQARQTCCSLAPAIRPGTGVGSRGATAAGRATGVPQWRQKFMPGSTTRPQLAHDAGLLGNRWAPGPVETARAAGGTDTTGWGAGGVGFGGRLGKGLPQLRQ